MTFADPKPVILVDSTGASYTAGGGGAGTGAVNITQVGGNAVTTSVPVTLSSVPLPSGAASDATFAQTVSAATNISAVNGLLQLTPGRKGTALVQVTGTFVATLSLLGAVDNVNYVTFGSTPQFLNLNTGAYTATITAPGIYQTSMNGLVGAQIKATAYTSGTATVTVSLTDAPAMVALDASIPAGSAAIGSVTLGSGNIVNSLGRVNLYDGTNTVAIKASGVSAGITDPALVAILSPNTYAGVTAHALTGAATTNATAVKASAGTLFELDISNTTAATVYFKVFNLAAAPTVGTSAPVLVIPVAAGATSVTEFGQMGKRFTTGIAYSITGAVATSDTTAVAAGVLVGATYV